MASETGESPTARIVGRTVYAPEVEPTDGSVWPLLGGTD